MSCKWTVLSPYQNTFCSSYCQAFCSSYCFVTYCTTGTHLALGTPFSRRNNMKEKGVEHKKQTKHTHTHKTKQTKTNQPTNHKTPKAQKTQATKRGPPKIIKLKKHSTTQKSSQNPAKALLYHGKMEKNMKNHQNWDVSGLLPGLLPITAIAVWTDYFLGLYYLNYCIDIGPAVHIKIKLPGNVLLFVFFTSCGKCYAFKHKILWF